MSHATEYVSRSYIYCDEPGCFRSYPENKQVVLNIEDIRRIARDFGWSIAAYRDDLDVIRDFCPEHEVPYWMTEV